MSSDTWRTMCYIAWQRPMHVGHMASHVSTCMALLKARYMGFQFCDTPKPGGPLTTRQPVEYSWLSGYPTPLMKIEQNLLCMRNSTQGTTCPNNQQ